VKIIGGVHMRRLGKAEAVESRDEDDNAGQESGMVTPLDGRPAGAAGGRTESGPGDGALSGIRVVDLSTGIAGPAAAMFLADFGADVVKVEPPQGDPRRAGPGFPMWNRNKRGIVVDAGTPAGAARLAALLAGADLCISGGDDGRDLPSAAAPEVACAANPALVYLRVPPFLDTVPWSGGRESAGLLHAYGGLALRQNSFDGGPVDPAFAYVLYAQAVWAAAAAMAALLERERSGHGQLVTVGGAHGTMIASTSSFMIDPQAAEAKAANGPGGPGAMYTRYRCSDGKWVFMATLLPKFQHQALAVLGLADLLNDERVGGELENMLLPANRGWVRARFVETFAKRSSEEWLRILHEADVPVGPLYEQGDWLDSEPLAAIGMRADIDDPERGRVVMPANPIKMSGTPATIRSPAPRLGEHDADMVWEPRPAPAGRAPAAGPALAGLRVLDLGAVLAGPYAGTLLAELGADVIKVEIPAGDSWRDRGMAYIRGQRGLAIDLRSDAGRAAFYRLVQTADVVLDNYRAGVLKRLAIDYPRLREVHPGIVSVSITGFGEDSPFAGEAAFDPILQARSGMMTAQGGDSEPVLNTVAINDVTTAATAVLASLLGVFAQRRTGHGQHAGVALAATSAYAQSEELVQVKGRPPAHVGGRDFRGPGPLDRSYETADGWVRLQADPVSGPAQLRAAGLIEGAEPASDDEWTERLAAALAPLQRDDAVRRLTDAGIPAVPARRLHELAEDADYAAFEVLTTLERGELGPTLAPARYAAFSRTRQQRLLTPPGVGEHSTEVLFEAGLTTEEIDALIASGAVRQGKPIVYRSFLAYR
jgi:crotonobetainyl-CoA:carnitine CoA-transferase CaiB-like acyl-CoA transferase